MFYFMFIVIFGALVMPTLLVAVITAATDESTHHVAEMLQLDEEVTIVKGRYPSLLTPARIELYRAVFQYMDHHGNGTLSVNDVAPSLKYIDQEFIMTPGV